MMNTKSYARGFTLIEVLVAVVILSIGLLGLAGLQARSLQYNYSAYQRSQATMLAYDIIDRMRANVAISGTGGYNIATGDAPPSNTDCQTSTATCDPATMASFDLSQWKCSLGSYNENIICTTFGITGALLDGVGSITTSASGVVTVTVEWTDDITRKSTDSTRKSSFTVSTTL